MLKEACPSGDHDLATHEPSEVVGSVPTIQWAVGALFFPVDASSLIVVRIGLGTFFAWWAWDYLESGRVTELYIAPKFHFSYYYFDWIQPWPGDGMYLHFAAILLFAVGVALGAWYRLSAALLATSFTYVLLIDRTNYQNHYYLMALMSWLLVVLPLNRSVSFDASRKGTTESMTVPIWMLWLTRFHVALPYIFGGVAKINADWLAGHPMQEMLAARTELPIVGPLLAQSWMVPLAAWGSMLFDLSIVPLLFWQRCRTVAFVACVGFHLANAVLFNIHVFPWLMILMTTVMFHPDWPRKVLGGQRAESASLGLRSSESPPADYLKRKIAVCTMLFFAYVGFHLVWPLRHLMYEGNASWTEQGHHFAWRMMLRGKVSAVRYYVTDCQANKTYIPRMKEIISQEQFARFSHDPEMILQLAHYLAQRHLLRFGNQAQVRVLALASLNGRKPQLLIDPDLDLAKIGRHQFDRTWVLPLQESLLAESWSVPIANWEKFIEIPKHLRADSPDPFTL